MFTAFTVAIGVTVSTKVIGNPVQPNGEFGVTVTVALIELTLFVVTNDGILPLPLAANPIAGLLFTQVYVVPDTGLVNTIGVVVVLAHNVWLATAFTVAVGLTVMVNVLDVPTQLTPAFVNVGVTVMVAVTGALVVLVAIKDAMLPAPVAANPIDAVLLTQL